MRKYVSRFPKERPGEAAFDALLSPRDKGSVIRHVDLFPHAAHHAEVDIRVHTELGCTLACRCFHQQEPQYDSLFAGQGWVQSESGSTLDADHFGVMLHRVT